MGCMNIQTAHFLFPFETNFFQPILIFNKHVKY